MQSMYSNGDAFWYPHEDPFSTVSSFFGSGMAAIHLVNLRVLNGILGLTERDSYKYRGLHPLRPPDAA
jgi:hypothetical protein